MIDYDALEHHPATESIAGELRARMNRDDTSFFRLMAAYYFSVAASSMRTLVRSPEGKKVPVCFYGINLAPSGYGKTVSMDAMESEVLNQFQDRFVTESFPLIAQENFVKLSQTRAARNASDPDHELEVIKGEFGQTGPYLFTFSSGTSQGLMQMRHKLLMAKAGALNLVMDEAGQNFTKSKDMLDSFLELYDGKAKDSLVKNTKENARRPQLTGQTPANMMLFSAPNKLLDGSQTETEFRSVLEIGHARRSFFGYININTTPAIPTLEEAMKELEMVTTSTTFADFSDQFARLADPINFDQVILMPDESKRLYVQYKLDCMRRASEFQAHEDILRNEMGARHYKALKLAGAYAFIDGTPEITTAQFEAAIRMAEDSGDALKRILKRESHYMKLAKHIAALKEEITEADLVEELPFFPKANNLRKDMMQLAISWGYKNNIIIKRSVTDGIEFLRGESLEETDLSKMILSYSNDPAVGYKNDFAKFEDLHKLTQLNGMQWVNHHLKDGHRRDENAIPGFNMVVIDVDGGINLDTAKLLLKDYKAMYYTTRSNDPAKNDRFRIVFPTNYVLKLDDDDFKEFSRNIFEWLPFEVDEVVGQRNRMWFTNNGHYEYTDGDQLDVLPFIPKTKKNDERRSFVNDHASLDNLERWVLSKTDGNRNNMLLRYGMILVDSNYDMQTIKSRIFDLNEKLPEPLDQAEIVQTILVSVTRAIAARP
jgi:hypothetical protein